MVGIARRLSTTYLPVAPGRFVITFVGMKAIAFTGLLWLAGISGRGVFGAIELSLAIGMIVGTSGLIGIHGAAPKLALTMGRAKIDDLLAFAAFVVASLAAAGSAVVWLVGLPALWALCIACCAPAAAQATLAAYARTRALPMMNSIVDPLAAVVMICVVGVLHFCGRLTVVWLAGTLTVVAFAIALVAFYAFLRCLRPGFTSAYREALSVGWPILVFGLVGVSIGAGLRPLLAAAFSLQALAVYSLCYRLAGGLLIFHQVLTTAIFSRLYMSGPQGFDRLVMGASTFLTLVALAMWVLLPRFIGLAFPAYRDQAGEIGRLFPLVGSQVILWILNALLENRINRHGASRIAAGSGFGLLFLYIPLVFLVHDLRVAVAMFDIVLMAFSLIQVTLLWRKNDALPLTAMSVIALGIGSIACLSI